MKTITKKSWHVVGLMIVMLYPLLSCQKSHGEEMILAVTPKVETVAEQHILIALLLDTSNSMDGLIEQAKSQLWKIVNEMAIAKCQDGTKPQIRIALYEYGNDRLVASSGYIRLVSPLTNDLDYISAQLFGLTTNGGSEYCGQVINKSLVQLEWTASSEDLKMIFIAGNEPFTQGEVPYQVACKLAQEKGVVVNTIFCGPFDEGVQGFWKAGADITGGSYMSIEQDRKTVYVPTPYDDKIAVLNDKLNSTYIYYGSQGASKKAMQQEQDVNAGSYSQSNKVERAISKSSHAYQNSTWDLVDAAKDDEDVVTEANDAYLPAEMKGMSGEQRKSYVASKAKERAQIQDEIATLSKKRKAYIQEHTPKSDEKTLDATMIKSIKQAGRTKKLQF